MREYCEWSFVNMLDNLSGMRKFLQRQNKQNNSRRRENQKHPKVSNKTELVILKLSMKES